MAVPVWSPGQVLTASDVNNWLAPQAVTKPSDQSVTSSTTLVNDTALTLPVIASAVYNFQCFLDYEGFTQGSSDLKLQFSLPAGAVMHYTGFWRDTTGTIVAGNLNSNTALTVGTNGAGVLRSVFLTGRVTISSTVANVTLQWAQNTSAGTATIVHAGSYLQWTRTS